MLINFTAHFELLCKYKIALISVGKRAFFKILKNKLAKWGTELTNCTEASSNLTDLCRWFDCHDKFLTNLSVLSGRTVWKFLSPSIATDIRAETWYLSSSVVLKFCHGIFLAVFVSNISFKQKKNLFICIKIFDMRARPHFTGSAH